MRVAQVCPYDLAVPGGVQAQVRGLAEWLTRAGHTADVIGPGRNGSLGLGRTTPIRVNGSVARIVLDPSIKNRLLSQLEKYDVVHVHEPLMPMVSRIATETGRPVVGTLHADPAPWTRRLLAAGMGRRVLDRCEVLTAVSPVAASAVTGRLSLVPNGITDDLFEPGEKEAGLVLFVGQDEPRKGLDILLAAWPEVQAAMPHARLAVISGRASGSEHVTWLGRISDDERHAWLRRASVLVAPNRLGESFGMVVAEGLAAGCQVVASDLPAFRWVLAGHGVLVEPGNAAALGRGLLTALAGDHDADGSREAARRFAWSEVGAQYLNVLESVC